MKTRNKKEETIIVSLRLTASELSYLKTLAKKLKQSVSETIRQAVLAK